MTLVVDKFRSLLPPRAKHSPSGWTSFNAPCCHHRGHKQDTRKRAGVRFDGDGIVYNCFNCKFSTGWQPGSTLGEKMKSLLRWMGASDDTIKEMVFESLKTESDDFQQTEVQTKIEFTEQDLPEGAMPIHEWVSSSNLDSVADLLEPVIKYLVDRGFNPMDNNFYWTPVPGFLDRVIIPFRYEGKIVGNTARKVVKGTPKYISDQQPNFVFNFNAQSEKQKYLLVVEGPFDALSVNGVALLHNEISEQQARIINSLGVQVIVIPDQDRAGLNLFDRAAELDWSIASPNWDDDVKDSADAVQRYGKLFVIVDAIKTAEKGAIRINMAKKRLEHKLEKQDDDKETP
jgi:hypothetical protein